MKLLSKSNLAVEIATQRRLEIEKGILLAQKVDALTEKLRSLQEQEDKFIKGQEDRLKTRLSSLEEQIRLKLIERDELSTNIKNK